MKQLLIFAVMFLSAVASAQKPQEINLWPEGPRTNNGDPEDQAKVWVYLPDANKATGRAVVCCPGGGYQHLAMQHEGHDWAPFFTGQGATSIWPCNMKVTTGLLSSQVRALPSSW